MSLENISSIPARVAGWEPSRGVWGGHALHINLPYFWYS